jgi:Bacterial Ig-like domain (group 3)
MAIQRRTIVPVAAAAAVICMWMLAGVAWAAGPVNAGTPTITGTAQQGQTLTVHPTTWTDATKVTVTNHWERCTTTCAAISGATGATYKVTAADVGKTIEVAETGKATDGSTTVDSAPTAVVTATGGPASVSPPMIAGAAQEGSVLTLTQGTWTPTPTSITDQWQRCNAQGTACADVAGSSTYTLTSADVGSTLRVVETATDTGGTTTKDSAVTAVIVIPPPGAPQDVTPPTVSGPAEAGQTLVASPGAWTGSPTSFAYQWERCGGSTCAAIPGASGQAYTAGAGDVGQAIAVLVTAANPGGSSAPAVSAQTAPVVATSSLSLVALPGGPTADQTVTLLATVDSGSGDTPPVGSVTFLNGDAAIPGCAGESFRASSQSITLICQTSFAAGAVSLSAVYQPASGSFLMGSAGGVGLTVGQDATSTSLAVTQKVSRTGRAVFTATIVLPASNSGPATPTGWVEFLDRGRAIRSCLKRPLTRLSATCTMKYKTVGRHEISALYSGDANFGGSRSAARAVRIIRGKPGPVVLGFVSSVLEWQFTYHPRYTLVTGMRADDLVKGMTVVLGCQGGGCPFSRISVPVRGGTSVDLLSRFHRRHLQVGTQITLWMTRPHWVGKYYSFTVRPGHGPEIALSCLGVGSLRPGVGC